MTVIYTNGGQPIDELSGAYANPAFFSAAISADKVAIADDVPNLEEIQAAYSDQGVEVEVIKTKAAAKAK